MIARTPPAKKQRSVEKESPTAPPDPLFIYKDPPPSSAPPTDSSYHMLCTYQCRQMVVYQIASLIVINFRGGSLLLKNYPSDLATKVKNTMMFNAFVICQISVVLHARKTGILSSPLKWVTSNSLFLVIAGTILVIQFIIIQFLGKIFFTVRLSWAQWQYCFSLGLVELAFAVIIFSKNFAQRHL